MLTVRVIQQTSHEGIGERIRELRNERKLTIQVLATSAGISTNTLSKIELEGEKKDPVVVEYATLEKIAEVLKVNVDELIKGL